jgi:hypothetical protein
MYTSYIFIHHSGRSLNHVKSTNYNQIELTISNCIQEVQVREKKQQRILEQRKNKYYLFTNTIVLTNVRTQKICSVNYIDRK